MQIIHAAGVRDWLPKKTGAWYSQYPPEVYSAAQRGEARHPLQSIIEDALSVDAGDSHNLTLTNGPTGIAPDIAAYLSGEPDCMIDADYCKTQRGPVAVFVDIGVDGGYTAEQTAQHIAKIARAVYSVGLVRPVTVTFYLGGRATARHEDAFIFLPGIDSCSCIDAGLLALIADSRTMREHLIELIPGYNGRSANFNSAPAKFDGVNVGALHHGQRPPTVSELIEIINT